MKYFYDTEFIDDGKTIDLISIGIVCEDGRELYFESSDADLSKASDWVKNNVIVNLKHNNNHDIWFGFYGSRAELKSELLDFCDIEHGKPEFWAYYADYDHVVLCQLFGTMMDLPKGWPMYTRDIKQLCDSLGNPELPDCKNKHNALDDALWCKEAYAFLMAIK